MARANARLAREQQSVHDQLNALATENPQSVEQLSHSWQWAKQSTFDAASSLQQREQDAEEKVAQASRDLEALHNALEESIERAALIESLTLEHRLRKNMGEYSEMQQEPEEATSVQRSAATRETKDIVEKLDSLADKLPPPSEQAELDTETQSENLNALQQALSDERKQQVEQASHALREAREPDGIKGAAGDLNHDLEQIAEALQQQNQSASRKASRDRLAQQMKAMQRRVDELQAARQFVQESLLKQRDLERAVRRQPSQRIMQNAPRQEQLKSSFEQYTRQHPEPFRDATSECREAGSNMSRAEQSMRSGQADSQQHAGDSANALQKVDDALERQQQQNRLADAQRLQQMLQEQADRMREMEKNASSARSSDCKHAAGQCNSLANQFQKLASQGSPGSGMSQQPGQAMNEGERQKIEGQGQQLSDAQSPEQVEEAAGELAKAMQRLADALGNAFGPGMFGQAGGSPLTPGGQEALNRGLRRLESEALQTQRGRPMPAGAANPLRQGAMTDLALGIHDLYGYNEKTSLLVQNMRRDLVEPEFRVDKETVQSLLSQIQSLRREVSSDQPEPDQENPLVDFDPARLPPEYRKQIENYFKELSKQK
jgi:hypothetical protein